MGLLAAHVARLKAMPLGLPIGSQTYPHRTRIRCGDFTGLLTDMKAIGIEVVELCDPGYPEFASLADGKAARQILDDHGMKALSAHFQMNALRADQQKQIDWALELGMTQMSTASLNGRIVNGVTTEDEVKRAAYEYNKIGELAKPHGLQQVLHTGVFEYSRIEDGRLTLPVLLQHLDSDLVKMQFQMSHMPRIGNPIVYFTNHPGRFISLHLQGVDAAAGMQTAQPGGLPVRGESTEGGRTGGAPADPCAAPAAGAQAGGSGDGLAIGEDTADWPAIFEAAKIGGAKNYFIEQSWDLTVKSAAYLKTLS
jgi:sugar phosphate isomerase/epimerase